MCYSLFGHHLDLHFGGHDLKHPHHENEMAQCQAHLKSLKEETDWCNFFVHAGHLHLTGEKMSKSTGNFTTIRQFLDSYPADLFRLFCILSSYNKNADFSTEKLESFNSILSKLKTFYSSICKLVGTPLQNTLSKWDSADEKFLPNIKICRVVEKDLEDGLSYHHAIEKLMRSIAMYYMYLAEKQFTRKQPSQLLLQQYFQEIKAVLFDIYGFSFEHSEAKSANARKHDSFIEAALSMRHSIRQLTFSAGSVASIKKQDLYKILDTFRTEAATSGILITDEKDRCSWRKH
jgi:cysteinyl-tRNA synthetase